MNAVGENTIEVSAAGDQNVRIEFDPATGLPSRLMYREAGQNGSPAETTEILSDWRDTAGFKLPYKAVQQENGMKVLEVTVSEYKINSGLTEADLSKKP